MKPSRGASLLELLVAQALGLMVVAGLIQSLTHALDQQRQNEDRHQLSESAQLIARVLQTSVPMAGYIDWTDSGWALQAQDSSTSAHTVMPGGISIFACPGDMQGHAPSAAAASSQTPPRCGNTRSLRETLQTVHQGASTGSADPRWHSDFNGHSARDCLQQHPVGPWVVNRFYLSTGPLGWQLLCAGSGNSSGQALAMGVQEWVLRFLVRHPNGLTQWITTADMGPAEHAHWRRVVRVEMCWVMVSGDPTRGGSSANRLQRTRPTCARRADGQWAADTPKAVDDRHWWERHTQTVALLNNTGAAP